MVTNENVLSNCLQLYEKMLEEIRFCKHKGLDPQDELQICFEIATNYKIKLLEYACNRKFKMIEDEIIFFKKVKPSFNAEIEYFSFCYHVLLFEIAEPPHSPYELKVFYQRQLQRLEKFKKEHLQFYEYMTANGTAMDLEWFTCQAGNATESSHDKLAGTYLALVRYKEWIELKLQDAKINR